MPRVLIVGIDGLPPGLLRQMVAGGRMPEIGGLARGGCGGVLESTPNYQSASAWSSLVTGANPGAHGIFHFTNPVRGSYRPRQITAADRRAPSLWRLLSDEGLRVAAMNVPVSYPTEPVNGAVIAGWLCPSAATPGFTHPPELAEQVVDQFGAYPIHPDVRRHALSGRYERVAKNAAEGIRYKLRVARWLVARKRPDVACAVVTELDSLQHWCWHLLDRTHPEHDAEGAERWRETLTAPYEVLDRELSRLLEEVGPDCDLLIVSDHGQAPNSCAQVLLRPWLIEAGYLVPRRRGVTARAADGLLGRGLDLARNCLSNRLKSLLRARVPALLTRAQSAARGMRVDWSATRAWTEAGHVFVNLAGRWPEGIVADGDERRELLQELEQELRSLVDADTGEPAVREITRGEDVFSGPEADLMPDLLVHWRNHLRVRALRWRGRRIEHPSPPVLPTGAHHPAGTLIGAGPSFASIRDCRRCIYDVAPTVMHLCGLPVPSYMDGEVMTDLLVPEAAKDVRTVAVNHQVRSQRPRPAASGDDVVARRLRSLGYIE
ncbi:MAG: alkaline phosphatase family protein [Armatimonadota bacterium]|nr:alkaline phosphatase family protein [Armatimonadota bacterium]